MGEGMETRSRIPLRLAQIKLILNIQGSLTDLRAGRLAALVGADTRVRKSYQNQSRYLLHLFLWRHM